MMNLFRWLRRYITVMGIIVAAFVAYTLFFQESSVAKYMGYSHTIDSLKVEIKNYTDTMNYYHEQNTLLRSDRQAMERIVREQYNMNRDGEDVYVFE